MATMEGLSRLPGTDVTAQIYEGHPIREAYPDQFAVLVQQHKSLLDQKVDHRIYKSEGQGGEKLRSIGDELGFLRASPRDVIEIHSAGLRLAMRDARPGKAQAYLEEARIVALELMGHLAAYYRHFSGRLTPKRTP